MPIAPLAHAALSAAAVGILLCLLHRTGPRIAGLAAAAPINSLPALFWLSQQQGGTFAASAAFGALLGTGLTVAVGAAVARFASARHAGASPGPALLAHDGAPRPARGRRTLLAMGTAGAMSLLVAELSRHSGPQLCGVVAAVPVIGMLATWIAFRQGGTARMLRVVAGYLDGMGAKAAFLAALGTAWAMGAGGWAWPLGLAAAALVLRARRPCARADGLAVGRRQ